MYAQMLHFDGPRSPELVAAAEYAGRERVGPAVAADPIAGPAHVATFVLRRPDGGEVVLTVFDTQEALYRSRTVIMSTQLLPGEDPALLPGPDRIEEFVVAAAVGRDQQPIQSEVPA